MGKYDDIKPDDLKADLRRFAELILRLDAEDRLLEATPRLLSVLGDLRLKIFAYEVRVTGRLAPEPEESEEDAEVRRIIEEAIRRTLEAPSEWSQPWTPEEEPD